MPNDPRACFRRDGGKPDSSVNFLEKWEESENPASIAALVTEAPERTSAVARITLW